MNPQELKTVLSQGLLSFPLTDFDEQGNFAEQGYRQRLEWLAPYGASALFAAGGTGEFFSLTGEEYPGIIRAAVDVVEDRTGKTPLGKAPEVVEIVTMFQAHGSERQGAVKMGIATVGEKPLAGGMRRSR